MPEQLKLTHRRCHFRSLSQVCFKSSYLIRVLFVTKTVHFSGQFTFELTTYKLLYAFILKVTYSISLRTSEVPTPKFVKNDIRHFEMITGPCTSLNHPGITV